MGWGRSTIGLDLLLVGAVLVSITGSLGGTMVYRYGVGTPPTLVAARHSRTAAATNMNVSASQSNRAFHCSDGAADSK